MWSHDIGMPPGIQNCKEPDLSNHSTDGIGDAMNLDTKCVKIWHITYLYGQAMDIPLLSGIHELRILEEGTVAK